MINETIQSTVLIVDDAPSNIRVMAASLQDRYQIKTALSGNQCIEFAVKYRPDVILLDIEMPGISGYDVCKKLKSMDETSDIPIIFVTGRDNAEDEEIGLRIGAVDYITKPIRPIILSARVDTHVTLKHQKDRLVKMAMHDQLTSLFNRHYLLQIVDQKIARARRHKTPMSTLIIDIDHFKVINDNHGHIIGDLVLEAVGRFLQDQCRVEDTVARFGGEEFVILMEPCGLNQAYDKAEIIRNALMRLNPMDIPLTVSIGLAELNKQDKDFSELLKRADEALYKAKASGRNCSIMAGSPPLLSTIL